MKKVIAIMALVAVLLVGSVSAIGYSKSATFAHKEGVSVIAATPTPYDDGGDDGPDTPNREASGGHGGCSEYETVIVNGMITPKCLDRENDVSDIFWMLHPWLA